MNLMRVYNHYLRTQGRINLVLCLLPDGARVENDDVCVRGILGALVANSFKRTGHALTVCKVHLFPGKNSRFHKHARYQRQFCRKIAAPGSAIQHKWRDHRMHIYCVDNT